MLVLTRRHYEAIVLQCGGETITLRVLRIGQEHVRIGVAASKAVNIDREEIYERKQEDKKHGK